MSTTFQPFVFVTTECELAQKFSLLENSNKSFLDILQKIDSENPSHRGILLSPTKNNEYFQSFNYNIGYDKNDIFSINLEFIVTDPFFEDYFVRFIFNEQKYKKEVDKILVKEKATPIKNKIENDPNFQLEEAQDLFYENKNLITVNNILGKKIESFCYFVFGINNRASTPIVAQFIKCEITQSSDGYKILKATFVNSGHPGILSELSYLNFNKPVDSQMRETYDEHSYKVSEVYRYTDIINIPGIVTFTRANNLTNKKLVYGFNHLIRTVLLNLFYKVTNGQDILLLLPDFDKLFAKFEANYKLPAKLQLALTSDVLNFKDKVTQREFYVGAEFLRFLGFNVQSDHFLNVQQREAQLPEGSTSKIEKLDSVTKTITSELKNYGYDEKTIAQILAAPDEQSRLRAGGITKERWQDPAKVSPLLILEVFKKVEQRNRELAELLRELTLTNRRTEEIKGYTGPLTKWVRSNFPEVDDAFLNMRDSVTNFFTGDNENIDLAKSEITNEFSELVPVTEEKRANMVDYDDQNEIKKVMNKINNASIIFEIFEKEDDSSYSTTLFPKKSNSVNFHKFLSEFSNKIAQLEQNYPIRIGFYEENDLTRLAIIKDNCRDHFNNKIIKSPRNQLLPALVIGEQFLIRNLLYPVTTAKSVLDPYPYDVNDVQNFGINSSYYKEIQRYRKVINSRYKLLLNSSFDEGITSDTLNILNASNNINKDVVDPVMPVFISNDSKGNVLTYSMDVDKQNHRAAYDTLIKYNQKALITDSLIPFRRSVYDKILNYDVIKKEVETFISTGGTYEGIFYGLQMHLRDPNSTYYIQRSLNQNSGFTNFESLSNSSKNKEDFIKTFASYLVEDLISDLSRNAKSEKTSFSVSTDIKLNPVLKKKQLLNDLYTKLFTVNLKTLPFFDINNVERLYSGAVLIIKNIMLPNETIKELDEFNFLTGVYRIKAFRHVITTTNAYSEFNLIKDLDIGGIEA